MDFLDRLYSQYQDFFDELDFQLEQEFSDDFDLLDEPDNKFMMLSDFNASRLLLDFLGDL